MFFPVCFPCFFFLQNQWVGKVGRDQNESSGPVSLVKQGQFRLHCTEVSLPLSVLYPFLFLLFFILTIEQKFWFSTVTMYDNEITFTIFQYRFQKSIYDNEIYFYDTIVVIFVISIIVILQCFLMILFIEMKTVRLIQLNLRNLLWWKPFQLTLLTSI